MKPAVVYVLADGAAGLYSRMAVMSVYSLRRYHPDIPVWLVMDPETFGRLERLGSALIDMATPVVEKVPVQFYVTERSRYLKTRMRSIVQGDFLYIDTDTIICAPLDGIDRVDADLAAVADANSPLGLWYPDTIAKCEKAGFAGLKGKPYYNGGVLFVRDTASTHRFFEEWHRLWLQSRQRGILLDQPALCQAGVNLGCPVHEVNGTWNCQIGNSPAGLYYYRKARILHYFTTMADNFVPNVLLPHISETGLLDAYAQQIASDPRSQDYRLYYASNKGKALYLWSGFLHLLRSRPKLFAFFHSLPGRLDRMMPD